MEDEENRHCGSKHGSQYFAFHIAPAGKFFNNVTAKAGANVKRVVNKGSKRHQAKADAERSRNTDKFHKAADAHSVNKVRRFGNKFGIFGKNHNADDGNYCNHAFKQHCAVANGSCVRFFGKLLAAGAGRYKGMEAGAGTAGNGDEKYREHRRPEMFAKTAVGVKIGKGGIINFIAAKHNADCRYNKGNVKEVTAKRAAGLQQKPHRHHCRYKAVNQN